MHSDMENKKKKEQEKKKKANENGLDENFFLVIIFRDYEFVIGRLGMGGFFRSSLSKIGNKNKNKSQVLLAVERGR